MNWIDVVLLIIVLVSLIWGIQTGVMRTLFVAIGIVLGWWLAGQFADDVGGLVGDLPALNSIVTAVAYWVIIIGTAVVVKKVGDLIRSAMVVGTLGAAGFADRLGGLLLGLIIAIALTSAVVIALTRLSSDFTLSTPNVSIPGTELTIVSGGKVAVVESRRDALTNSLAESSVVSAFLTARDALPEGMLGFVPGDFQAGFDILEDYISEAM